MKAKSLKTKVLLVEDNANLSENISELLKLNGYEVLGIYESAEEAGENMMESSPDLVLIDIKLKGKKTGIELAEELRRDFQLPLVFITSASGKEVISRVKYLEPDGFIVKPFTKESLITTVELAISNYKTKRKKSERTQTSLADTKPHMNEIFIRDNGWLKKIKSVDILWIKAEGTYTHLNVGGKQYTLRNTVKEIMGKLDENEFVRVHKSFIVNLEKIEAFNHDIIKIEDSEIPIGRNYYKDLINRVNKINN
ncbi:response regulator [Algoriphagus sp. H41]|uniref:Response regulator n=1 Tax=Algoriphagus oliviformis TaxID=2811231 RepID=A0ABS3C110_9BACT|nr:response regulator [Algoriphagus oliviformis]MBN7810800.1 response regulator [Algoriphagus oliviformis]